MTRIGMNKKTGEPVNKAFPFYYDHGSRYTPARGIVIDGPSRSFYDVKQVGSMKIVWMETDSPTRDEVVAYDPEATIISIDDKSLIMNNRLGSMIPVCVVKSGGSVSYCDEFIIDGPSALVYDPERTPSVWIQTRSNVVQMIGGEVDKV